MLTFDEYYRSYRKAILGGLQLDYVNAATITLLGGYLLYRYSFLRTTTWIPHELMLLLCGLVFGLGLYGLFFAIPRRYRFLEFSAPGEIAQKHEVVTAIAGQLNLRTSIKGSNFYEFVHEKSGYKKDVLVYLFLDEHSYRYHTIEKGTAMPISWLLNLGPSRSFNPQIRQALADATAEG